MRAPGSVRFTHGSIPKQFRSGLLLDEAIDGITRQNMSFDDFPPDICVLRNGNAYSLNNRRLFVARVLQNLGLIRIMRVGIVPFEHPFVIVRSKLTEFQTDDGLKVATWSPRLARALPESQ